jgi:hypothetical protein
LAAATPETGRFDRLGSTLFVAVLAHGVIILGVTFAPAPQPPPGELPTINATLLVDTGEFASLVESDLLAQRNQVGGSDVERLRSAVSSPMSGLMWLGSTTSYPCVLPFLARSSGEL